MHYKKRKLHKLHSIPIDLCNNINRSKRLYLVSYSIPLSCMIVLLLIGIFAINPSLALKTSAVTIQDEWVVTENSPSSDSSADVEDDGDIGYSDDVIIDETVNENPDNSIMPLLDDDWGDIPTLPTPACTGTSSSVSIVLADTSQTIQSVQGGDTVYGGYRMALGGCNLKDYALSLQADSENLTPPSGSSSTSIVRGASGKTGNEMMANTWGYNVADYNTADSNYGGLTYSSLSATPTVIASGTPSGNVDVYKKLVFAAKFAEDAAPGTYTGHITLSAVATEITQLWSDGTDSGIRNMQDISAGFCKSSLPTGATIKLRDSRDQQEYTIVKLRDGKCWMQENLKLGGSSAMNLTSSDTDLASGTSSWQLPASSDSSWSSSNTLAQIRVGKSGMAVSSSYPGDGKGWQSNYGNYYSWCAATAGSCSSATSSGAVAGGSICPKNWHLPTGNTNGEFYNVLNGLNFTTVQQSPYLFPAAGYIFTDGLRRPGANGRYWSSTANSGTAAYNLYFYSSMFNPGTDNNDRYGGYSVRCVAAL